GQGVLGGAGVVGRGGAGGDGGLGARERRRGGQRGADLAGGWGRGRRTRPGMRRPRARRGVDHRDGRRGDRAGVEPPGYLQNPCPRPPLNIASDEVFITGRRGESFPAGARPEVWRSPLCPTPLTWWCSAAGLTAAFTA